MSLTKYHHIVQDVEKFEELLSLLESSEVIAGDTETSSLDHMTGYLVGISFAVKEGEGWYIPLGHDEGKQLELNYVIGRLKPILEDSLKVIIFHNTKFDHRWLKKYGIDIPLKNCHCSLLEVFSENDGPLSFGLKYLSEFFFNNKMTPITEVLKGVKDYNMGHVSIDIAGPYACEDADICLRIHNRTFPKVRTNSIYNLESRLWPYVSLIEDTGFKADIKFLEDAGGYLKREAEKVKQIIYDQVEKALGKRVEFNIGSYPQLRDILYAQMKIPIMMRGRTGPSTSEEALRMLSNAGWSICHNIIVYRSMKSLSASLYSNNKKSMSISVKIDGRIHTSYNQSGTNTGRFSSSDPNIQNLARKKSWKVKMVDDSEYEVSLVYRDFLIADDDYYLLELDYKAIEFVIFAHGAGLKSVLDAYSNGLDPHVSTAAKTLTKPLSQVTKEERDVGKMQNYLVLFGGSAVGLEQKTDFSLEVCEKAIKSFGKAYPEFIYYSQDIIRAAKKTKYVTTHSEIVGGRHQIVPELKYGKNSYERSKGERSAISGVIQGSAADYLKVGLIRTILKSKSVWDWDKCHMVAQTHDSQTWEVHRSLAPQDVVPVLMDGMMLKLKDYPTIQVDAKIGLSWGSMYDYDETKNYDGLFNEWVEKRKVMMSVLSGEKEEEKIFTKPENNDIISKGIVVDLTNSKLSSFLLIQIRDFIKSNPGNTPVTFVVGNRIIELKESTSLTHDDLRSSLDAMYIECSIY